jgi:hypothetical protein
MGWAMNLIGGLTQRQWDDAFRAGGYPPDVAARYIAILRGRIAEGRAAANSDWPFEGR